MGRPLSLYYVCKDNQEKHTTLDPCQGRPFQNRQRRRQKMPATIQTSGEGRKGNNTLRTLPLQRCGCGLAYRQMWVWFCFNDCTCTSKQNKLVTKIYFRCRDAKTTETRIGMEGICITNSCIPHYIINVTHTL